MMEGEVENAVEQISNQIRRHFDLVSHSYLLSMDQATQRLCRCNLPASYVTPVLSRM